MAAMEILSWLSFVLLFCILIYKTIKKETVKFHWTGLEKPILGFVFFVILSAFFVEDITPIERKYILGSQRWVLLFYTYYFLFLNEWVSSKKNLQALIIFVTLVSIYSILQTFWGWDIFRSAPYKPTPFSSLEIWRAKGFFSNPITYANSINILGLFVLGLLLNTKEKLFHKENKFYWMSFLLISIALFFSFTRGAWLGFIVGGLWMALLTSRRIFLRALLSLIIIFITAFSLFTPFRERVTKTAMAKNQSSVSNRLLLWRSNFEMFKDHPYLGVGLFLNERKVQKYHYKIQDKQGMVGHAHNVYLQVLVGVGIFGFIFFVWFYGKAYFYLYKSYLQLTEPSFNKAILLGSLGALTSFYVSGLTEPNFFDGEVTHMFVFLLAFSYSIKNRMRSKIESEA
ncbi:MAG: O-antigen ligase family protein [Bdellovibrionales bacterium]|nr:O-antigen ligase family protein [Bdellovibrionales bacterium]